MRILTLLLSILLITTAAFAQPQVPPGPGGYIFGQPVLFATPNVPAGLPPAKRSSGFAITPSIGCDIGDIYVNTITAVASTCTTAGNPGTFTSLATSLNNPAITGIVTGSATYNMVTLTSPVINTATLTGPTVSDFMNIGGANPSSTGAIRLPNNAAISFRNSANSADQVGITLNAGNQWGLFNNGTISDGSNFFPNTDTVGALGQSTKRWNGLFMVNTLSVGGTRTTQTAVTVTASPFTYTNNDSSMETVYINGGTISNVSFVRNSTTTTLFTVASDITIILSNGDGVQITYTVAPTMIKVLF